MTVTETRGHRPYESWSIDDLQQVPDEGMRYEIVDGCLLVSPAATPRHGEVVFLLRELLQRQAPPGRAVSNDVGIRIGDNYTYFIPDLFVIPRSGFRSHRKYLLAADVRLAVEVLSEHSLARDRVLKRHYYASAKILRYWIVDPFERTLTVLALKGTSYEEEVVIKAGTAWTTDQPFPLTLDPAEFCDN